MNIEEADSFNFSIITECPCGGELEEPVKRIETESWSGLFSGGVEKINIFTCQTCDNEFEKCELRKHRKIVQKQILDIRQREKEVEE